MAASVDSFDFLWTEMCKMFREYTSLSGRSLSFGDYLTIFGGVCAASVVWTLTRRLYDVIKIHGLTRVLPASQLTTKYGPWAVVTGCTGGIGEAFVQELAGAGMHMVLISRSESALTDLALHLEEKFNIKTCIVPVDFNEGPPVYERIKAAVADKDIGILVNNVGVMYDFPQMFLDVPEEKIWQLVNVNVAAATMMTSIVLPGMVKRKRGAVITMSSGSGYLPTPQMTVYCATKAYLDVFMRALSHEYQNSGIDFQTLMPFYVATRMTQYSSTLSNPSMFIPSATNYARSALSTLGWTNRTTGFLPHTIQVFLSSLIPEKVWMWGAMRLNDALRRQAFTRLERKASQRKSKVEKEGGTSAVS